MGCAASLPAEDEFLKEFPAQPSYTDGVISTTDIIRLVVKEKIFSWSGDDFTVNDVTGKPYCKVKGKVMSMRDRIVITDLEDKPICCLLEKVLSM